VARKLASANSFQIYLAFLPQFKKNLYGFKINWDMKVQNVKKKDNPS